MLRDDGVCKHIIYMSHAGMGELARSLYGFTYFKLNAFRLRSLSNFISVSCSSYFAILFRVLCCFVTIHCQDIKEYICLAALLVSIKW